MIGPLITGGLGFAVNFLVTAGLVASSTTGASPLLTGGLGTFGGPSFIITGGLSTGSSIQPANFTYIDYIPPIALIQTTSAPGAPVPTYPDITIFIDGVNRSVGKFRVGQPSGPGIKINLQLNSGGTANLIGLDTLGLYAPECDEPIQIYRNTSLVFDGFIQRVTKRKYNGPTSATSYDVSCLDFGVIFDQREVGRLYQGVMAGEVYFVVADIVLTRLADLGVSLVFTDPLLQAILKIQFNYITVREAFNQLGKLCNSDWFCDVYRNLRFQNLDAGYTTAPTSFTTTSANYRSLKVTNTRVRFANKVVAKSSRNLGSIWTDTFPGDPYRFYNTTYAPVDPIITVNGVDQVVIELGGDGYQFLPHTPYDFYWLHGGNGVVQNYANTPLSPSDTVVVKYPSPLPFVGIARDEPSIAAIGERVYIVEAGDILSQDHLQDIAEEVLARMLNDPQELEIETDEDGFAPGQLLPVNVALPVVNDNFLITSISMQSYTVAKVGGGQRHFFRTTIKASNADFQQNANAAKFLGDIIVRTRPPADRIIEKMAFTLAETIEGLTNPGLSVGEKQPIRQAQKDGILGWVTLTFKSIVDGTPTSSDIEIDILKNGTSIFGAAGRLILLAGQTSVKMIQFASDNMTINAGDKVTLEVIQADATAMDGIMELVVLG